MIAPQSSERVFRNPNGKQWINGQCQYPKPGGVSDFLSGSDDKSSPSISSPVSTFSQVLAGSVDEIGWMDGQENLRKLDKLPSYGKQWNWPWVSWQPSSSCSRGLGTAFSGRGVHLLAQTFLTHHMPIHAKTNKRTSSGT